MKLIQAKHFTPAARMAVDLIVIHTMESGEGPATAENVAAWFAGSTAPQASAHYNVDCDSIVQSVLDKDIAWHAGPVNGYSIGIEHAGYAKQTSEEWADAASIATLERSAELVAGLCLKFGIAPVRVTADDLRAGMRHGICGHVDVTMGLTGGKGHTDPGEHFPWPWYLDRVASWMARTEVPAERVTAQELDPTSVEWVRVGDYLVAPNYIAPIGIGEAERMAEACGCELPTPELVDAIWQAADLRIDPMPRDFKAWTMAEMSSIAVLNDQAKRIEDAIAGRPYRLLAGTHKDVVMKDGVLGIYGWHRADGTVLQPFYAGHAPGWIDYSQALRFVRKVGG